MPDNDSKLPPGASRPFHKEDIAIGWCVGVAPFVALIGIALFLAEAEYGKLGRANYFVTYAIYGGIAVGIIGGLGLAATRRNWWWLLVTAASLGTGYVLLLVGYAIGMGQMH